MLNHRQRIDKSSRMRDRSASRVAYHRQRIGESSHMRDRSVSRVMNNRDRSKGRMMTFFEHVEFHREKR